MTDESLKPYVIGLDLGGTNSVFGIVDSRGDIKATTSIKTQGYGDSYDKDILPAEKAGCQTTWIKGEGWTDDDVEAPVAGRIIHDLSELL